MPNSPRAHLIWLALALLGVFSSPIAAHAQRGNSPLIPPASQQPTTFLPPNVLPVAAPTPAPAPVTTTVAENKIVLPFRKLIGAKDAIVLRNASSTYTLFIPHSARNRMLNCTLHLDYTNSIALITERSVLRVVMNDVIIAQYPLRRDKPNNVVDIDIPSKLVEVGFNRLQFIVAQHYTNDCEDPAAPELYTAINPDTSYLEATVEPRPIIPRLSMIRDWIDKKLWGTYVFNLCFPAGSSVSETQLAWGSVITQGVGLAVETNQFRVYHSSALRAGIDNIVVGTMTDLTRFLTSTEIGAINGSFLAVKPLPGDPTHFLIVISGRNEEEVGQAALAFSLINYPLPDSQYAILDSLGLPDKPMWVRNAPLTTAGVYGFQGLDFKSTTIKGYNTGAFGLDIYMPSELSSDDPSNIELRLHFAYGAAFRSDSTFNVNVNGQFQTVIYLNEINGAIHNNHRLYIPVRSFQPGRNKLDLVPNMVPLVSNHCEINQIENLLFTLYDDSDLVVPRLLNKARLPSLGLLSQTAFPCTASPDGIDLAVMVGRSEETVNAAWTLMGKMAQISGALMHRAEMSFKLPRSKKNLLIVAARDEVPVEVFERAPINPLQVGKLRYVVSTSPKPERIAATPVEEFIQKLRGQTVARAEPSAPSTADFNTITSDLVEDTILNQFESPFFRGYAATVVTAADGPKLLGGMNALQDRRIWDNLAGDLAVWSPDPRTLAIAKVGSYFVYGSTTVANRVSSSLSQRPWIFATFLVLALGLLGIFTRFILGKKERREHVNTGSDPEPKA